MNKATELWSEVVHEFYDHPKTERLEWLNSLIDAVANKSDPYIVIAWTDFKLTRTIREWDCIFDFIDQWKITLLITTNWFVVSEFKKHESHNLLS